ncbi:MAG: DUF1223 domain-containing protein [Arcobacter sp.]|nr:MAG: DUF1223 domain-containing protein [Arcobacter sp.]
MRKFLLLNLVTISFLFAQGHTFESNGKRVNIIELYTSQGCSSCPPADKWLSKLKNHPKLFTKFIPMAFHVTYWDFIGWKDIFADKLNDNRQRYYANKIWKNNSVYTPQFIINTKEYRKWFSNQSFPKFDEQYGGKLISQFDNNLLKVSYYNKNIKNEKLYLNIAILGFDYKIDIKSGENKNKLLEHDFVVIKHIQKFAEIKNNNLKIETKLAPFRKENNKYALAVWISSYNTNILQATGGYI